MRSSICDVTRLWRTFTPLAAVGGIARAVVGAGGSGGLLGVMRDAAAETQTAIDAEAQAGAEAGGRSAMDLLSELAMMDNNHQNSGGAYGDVPSFHEHDLAT